MGETKKLHEVHPGRILKEELAALGTGARLWLAMQQAYDLRKVETELGAKVRAEVQSAA